MANEFITINHVLKYMSQAQTDEDNTETTNTVYVSFIIKKEMFSSCNLLSYVWGLCKFRCHSGK